MDSRVEQFRMEAAKLGAVRRGRKFSKEMIELAAGYAASRRGEGAAWQLIADELDVAAPTIQRWVEKPIGPSSGFHSVAVVENRSTERYAAVLGSGLRIEGLSLEAVVSLARALS